MFYSETLLSKTGPLARVWLAANIERKLSKQNILQSNIESSVHTIIDTNGAPIALRLSGQLLLGVVRIYSRKARYLLDDCNEALMKIKLAFRPGNVDLPSNQSHTANPAALLLPDTITELDLFAPMPDLDELLLDDTRGPGQDPTLLDWGTSQILPDSMDTRHDPNVTLQLEDDDLGLDIGEDIATPAPAERSIEIGRRAETPRAEMREESLLYGGDDLGLDLGFDEPRPDTSAIAPPEDDDFHMGGMDNLDLGIEESNISALERAARQRDTASPLSEIDETAERELERTFQLEQQQQHTELEDEETMVQAQQRVKRRKVLPADINTELQNSQIKAQQEDRSKILKAPSFLPRDPLLLALMDMQRSGGFVSNILGDGRSIGWAPELRGILSLEVVRTAGELKRKRDSGVAQIEIPEEEEEDGEDEDQIQAGVGAESSLLPEQGLGFGDETMGGDDFAPAFPEDIAPAEEDLQGEGEEDMAPLSPAAPFDETTMPILHPAESGPVSLGTKHAVHLLRERFSDESGEEPDSDTRAQQSVLFTDICPEQRTSMQDATKMFFEMLVLGTKDAIKVEQGSDEIGAPIRIRGKRGLWGDWAEMGAGGEIASQSQRPAAEAVVGGAA